jgi:PAS domain S-box-containing protein
VNEKLGAIIFENIQDGVFTVNEDCIITSFNRAAEEITGFMRDEAIGQRCFDIFRTEVCHKQCALKDTLKSKQHIENVRVTIITKEGCETPISVSTTLLRDKQKNVVGAVEFFQDISEIEQLHQKLHQNDVLKKIISINSKMQQVLNLLPDVASANCNVLIEGPSGSGKELIAEAIHNLSSRKYGPYIRINCGALPATLLESELFGYEKGAFTDAKRNKPGMFCLAEGGTLLLDEISEMDISLQSKLLRVLNNGEYQPLGSRQTLHTDARIIAATNANLQEYIKQRKFREDLYFRINVVGVSLPALRERPEDIPVLVDHFMEIARKQIKKSIFKVSPVLLGLLQSYSFPGNVRELENAIQHSMVMCQGDTILPEHLPHHIIGEVNQKVNIKHPQEEEVAMISEALRRHNGNKTRAALELGMHRSTLWRKMTAYNLV